jgi:heme oxygenase
MLMQQLKMQTAHLHADLPQTIPLLQQLEQPTLTSYTNILCAYWGYYLPMEQLLDRAWAEYPALAGLDLAARHKTNLIERDLAFLGMDAMQMQRLPICHDLPTITTIGHTLGVLYVLEGATLGSQLIARGIEKALGLNEQAGCAFFNSYGREVGPMWKRFSAFVNQFSEQAVVEEAAVQAATATFQSFEAWLQHALSQTPVVAITISLPTTGSPRYAKRNPLR